MKSKVVILSLLLTGAAISASAQRSSIPKGLRTISLSVWVPEHKDV